MPLSSPFVSIIIPCRNEELFIAKCLDSILATTYPIQRLEILIVDGASEDATSTIIALYQKKYPFIRILKNQKKIIPVAMNIGITHAKGEIIMKMDAHTTYRRDYITKCIAYLKNYHVDNVGGVLINRPRGNGFIPRSIALCLSHRFGSGNSYFKTGTDQVRFVDTVAFGCYPKKVFTRIGLYNEQLVRSSDMELNTRLKNAGGKILLAPDIIGYYYADPSLLLFWKHNFKDGVWATYPLKFTRILFKLRHLLPGIFVGGLLTLAILSFLFPPIFILLIAALALYAFASLLAALHVAFKQKDSRYMFLMPVVFAIRHIGYGIGSLWGLMKIIARA